MSAWQNRMRMYYTVAAAQAFDYVGMPGGCTPSGICLYLSGVMPQKQFGDGVILRPLRAVEKAKDGEVPNHLKDSNRDKEAFCAATVSAGRTGGAGILRTFATGKGSGYKNPYGKNPRDATNRTGSRQCGGHIYERFFNTSSDIRRHGETAFFTFTGLNCKAPAEAVRQYPDADIHLNCASQQDVAVIRLCNAVCRQAAESVHYSLNNPLNRPY
ncbi:hypothetical protein CHS0354_006922 [Potamilus streckersoni]|uniref:Uncharacterized protein n=1 Tax=Potamilus streckersoni TaxID=2493646 RepID=A0AAE0WBU9_9BIVA|nr:hypothetical protein CHS0354_006922 [Potamilus streckersoni]